MTKKEIYQKIRKFNDLIFLNKEIVRKPGTYKNGQKARERLMVLVKKREEIGIKLLDFEPSLKIATRYTLKEARERVELDERMVASVIGVSLSALEKWEAYTTGIKLEENVDKLCRMYDLDKTSIIWKGERK